MAIQFLSGKILFVDGDVAVHEDCCCAEAEEQCDCDCGPATTTGPLARTDAPRIDLTITWTGSPTEYQWGGYSGSPSVANAVKFTNGETKTICPTRYARRPTTVTGWPALSIPAPEQPAEIWQFGSQYVQFDYHSYSYDFLELGAGLGGTCFPFQGSDGVFGAFGFGRAGGGIPKTTYAPPSAPYGNPPRGYKQGDPGGVGIGFWNRLAGDRNPTGGPPPTPSASRCANVTQTSTQFNQTPYGWLIAPGWSARTYTGKSVENIAGKHICQQHIEDSMFSYVKIKGDAQFGDVTITWTRSAGGGGGQQWKKSNTDASPWVP